MFDTKELVMRMCSKFELSDEIQRKLELQAHADDIDIASRGGRSTSVVGVTAVSTFVTEKSFASFYVPSFASHWGIVCDFIPGGRWLFHLVFDPATRKVMFQGQTWVEKWDIHRIEHVGTSPYGIGEVRDIGETSVDRADNVGERLAKGFEDVGEYHVIFWNCQLFAQIFLKIICKEELNFGTWTAAQVVRLVKHSPPMC
jgi:hypothetical protein